VRSYLVHYAYVETLQACQDEEKDCQDQPMTVPNNFPGLTQTNFGEKRDRKMTEDAYPKCDIDSEVVDSKMDDSPAVDRQNLPFSQLAGDMGNNILVGKIERSKSLFCPAPQVSDLVIQQSQTDFKPDSSINLRERAILKYKIQSGSIQDARAYLEEFFPDFYEKNLRSKALLDALHFISLIKNEMLSEAILFSQEHLNPYLDK
jgi:hypothetical protein